MRYQINYNYYIYGENNHLPVGGGGQHYHFGDGPEQTVHQRTLPKNTEIVRLPNNRYAIKKKSFIKRLLGLSGRNDALALTDKRRR